MERVMTSEERIRKSEEIYYRRQNQGVRVNSSSVNVGKSNKVSIAKKMYVQIIICVIIYLFFYIVKGYNTIFSQNIINTTKSVLSYDINLEKMYKDSVEYFNKNFNNIIPTSFKENEEINLENVNLNELESETNNETEQNITDNGENVETTENIESNNLLTEVNNNELTQDINTSNETPGIGGGTDTSTDNISQNKSQMELDAEYIKQNCSLIIPVQGIVTSGFGNRQPTEIISAFHQGIDIGAETGTAINASMEGTVVASSYDVDYGNHIKIQHGDILTVYAHCSELNVCVGDYVQQGQQIGKVGSTGKVTGPHLHFEIRKENRYVDPSLILNF